MPKKVDNNGFWLIRHNPVTKEGVFPYLGKSIDSSLNADEIYMVYRPFEEISNKETLESFNGVPLIEEHEMIGEGFTPYDERKADGVLFNTMSENGKMYGDIKIFSESLKKQIENGKKELSIGYTCDYTKSDGEFEGKKYQYIQTNITGNHIALVERGRAGRDVKVYDRAVTYDSLDIVENSEITEKGNEEKMNENEKKEICPACGKDPCECKDEKEETKQEETKTEEKKVEVTPESEKKEPGVDPESVETLVNHAKEEKEETQKNLNEVVEDKCKTVDSASIEKCVKDMEIGGEITKEAAQKLIEYINDPSKKESEKVSEKEEVSTEKKYSEDSKNELREMVKQAVDEAISEMKKSVAKDSDVHFAIDENIKTAKKDDWFERYMNGTL